MIEGTGDILQYKAVKENFTKFVGLIVLTITLQLQMAVGHSTEWVW